MAPRRIGNSVQLRLDRHLSPIAIREGQATIALPPEEMRKGKALDYLLDRDSCELMQTYLSRFRGRLAEPGNPFLFPSYMGGHKNVVTLRDQVTKLMRDELGAVWHPHSFRHLAAGLYLEENPGEYETVRRLLGHARLETTVRYYAGTEMAPSCGSTTRSCAAMVAPRPGGGGAMSRAVGWRTPLPLAAWPEIDRVRWGGAYQERDELFPTWRVSAAGTRRPGPWSKRVTASGCGTRP